MTLQDWSDVVMVGVVAGMLAFLWLVYQDWRM